MASDYHKWLARDVTQAEAPTELTKKEKWQTWWYYHWKKVAIGLLLAVFFIWGITDWIDNRNNQPDCCIAYIGTSLLPTETVQALEAQLASLFGDVDGNGKCIVSVQQYTVSGSSSGYTADDPYQQMAMTAQLASNKNFLFLLEDPAAFQAYYGLLIAPNGEETGETLWYSWSQSPALTRLPLGDYQEVYGGEIIRSGSSQALLSGLYIGRGAVDGATAEQKNAYTQIWETILSDN